MRHFLFLGLHLFDVWVKPAKEEEVMRVMELKATLYRANPVVIRQFTMPEGMTAAELGKAMRLLLGFKASVSWRMWNRDREFTEGTPLEEIFDTLCNASAYSVLPSSDGGLMDIQLNNILSAFLMG